MSEQEKCEVQKKYRWAEGKCELRESEKNYMAECGQRGDGSAWINGRCQPFEVVSSLRQQCSERKDGSLWGLDPENQQEACLGPKEVATAKDLCEKEKDKGFVWEVESGQCLGPEAFNCRKGGDFWTLDERCVRPTEQVCLSKLDNSVWKHERCVSKKEQECYRDPTHSEWDSIKNTCRPRSFAEMCAASSQPDGSAAKDIEVIRDFTENGLDDAHVTQKREQITAEYRSQDQTYLELKKTYGRGETDCAKLQSALSDRLDLDLAGKGIEDVAPLAFLPQLEQLDLSGNKINNIRVLGKLTKLKRLNLANNSITRIEGLATLSQLTVLSLAGNKIVDFTPIAGLVGLRSLDVSATDLKDFVTLFPRNPHGAVSVAKGNWLFALETLDLHDNCGLKDAKFLRFLRQLQTLDLRKTGVMLADVPPELHELAQVDEVSQCPP